MYDSERIKEVYTKGKGGIVCRGKTHVEEGKKHNKLIIDEIPYLVNKSNLVAKIGELVVAGKLAGVTDIRDESNRERMRIAVTIKREVNTDDILVRLYKRTDLQCNFNVNNVTLIIKEYGGQFTRHYMYTFNFFRARVQMWLHI